MKLSIYAEESELANKIVEIIHNLNQSYEWLKLIAEDNPHAIISAASSYASSDDETSDLYKAYEEAKKELIISLAQDSVIYWEEL